MNDIELTRCAICGSKLASKKIDYIDRSDDHFLIVRAVPVQECEENGHQFFQARVAKQIEELFNLDRRQALVPIEVISVPVVELDQTV
jgi:YgiT-type zinc finger domain-containing protein